MSESCAVNGCTGKHHANGLCHWHAQPQNEPDAALLRKPKEKKRKKPKPMTLKREPAMVTAKSRWRVRCDQCGGADPRKHQRVLPRNFRLEVALLCVPCGRSMGYTPVSYERPYAELAAKSIMRGAA